MIVIKMNIILNIFLLSIPARLKKRIAYLLSKYSKIFFESYLFQNIDFSLDKEISCLLELPVNFKNVIDGGANVGNWTECLLKQVNTIENLLLVEQIQASKSCSWRSFLKTQRLNFVLMHWVIEMRLGLFPMKKALKAMVI